jgi:replicative superfamily II helicase
LKLYHGIQLLIIDEVHLINSPTRGHVIENIILICFNLGIRIVLTTATMSYDDARILAKSIHAWLYYSYEIIQSPKIMRCQRCNHLIEQDYNDGNRFVVFHTSISSAIRNAVTFGDNKSKIVVNESLLKDICYVRPSDLGELMQKGICYHHGCLDTVTRAVLSKWITHREIKWVIATDTLAAGVDLYFDCIYITRLKRGKEYLNQDEITQMIGRGGRHSSTHNVYIVVKDDNESQMVDNVISGVRNPNLEINMDRI